MAPNAVRGSLRRPRAEPRWRLLGASMIAAATLLVSKCGFVGNRSVRLHQPHNLRTGRSNFDPVNNVAPEISAAGLRWAEKHEGIYLRGNRLWSQLKKKAEREGKEPPKIFFVGPAGNDAQAISEAILDCLSYIPAPDGTLFIYRKPNIEYPEIVYDLWISDKMLSAKSKISAVDLYMEDEDKYRELETEALKEFSASKFKGHPQAMVVGESAVLREENVEIIKKGLVIWLDASPEFTWDKTQYRHRSGSGIFVGQDVDARPPVWAIANGWDGDIDDGEGKQEYIRIAEGLRQKYREISELRLAADSDTVGNNQLLGAQTLLKAMSDYYSLSDADEESVEGEAIQKDLEKFLEGARLSKYLKEALEWCDEQGAASIEDIVENLPEFSDAMNLKPLERKRLEKAAASAV